MTNFKFMKINPLVVANENGFYCAIGDFYIDPWKPVNRAVITHAHADHYVRGCGSYLVAQEGEAVFRARLGDEAVIQSQPYGKTTTIAGVKISFHPAGHILGSAQIRLEYKGEVWVISGDYKTEPDRTSMPFEVVPCNHFITEATFGLPVYHWSPQNVIFDQINAWWKQNADEGKASIIYCYALGKAQRIQAGVDASIGRILTHGSVERINQAYRASNIALPETVYAKTADKTDYKRALIIAPLSARGTTYTRRFGEHASGYVSGWMRIRGARRRRAVDRGFVLSDHADWDNLLSVIEQTGAEHVGVTHGYTSVLSRWLQEKGLDAYSIDTRYAGENDDTNESAGSEETES